MPSEAAGPAEGGGSEALLRELETRVRAVVGASSWWEQHGLDGAILALSLLVLPAGEGLGVDTGPGVEMAGWWVDKGHLGTPPRIEGDVTLRASAKG